LEWKKIAKLTREKTAFDFVPDYNIALKIAKKPRKV